MTQVDTSLPRCASPLGTLQTHEDPPDLLMVCCTRERGHPGKHGAPITWGPENRPRAVPMPVIHTKLSVEREGAQ